MIGQIGHDFITAYTAKHRLIPAESHSAITPGQFLEFVRTSKLRIAKHSYYVLIWGFMRN